MIDLLIKDKCTGCSACEAICPHHAITMSQDEEGFLYPQIYPESCTECGVCKMICPIYQETSKVNEDQLKAFSVKLKNQDEMLKSTSGGAFFALACYVIMSGGIVWGAAFTEDFTVRHIAAHTMEELERLRKSKYVQSDISQVYKPLREQLEAGRMVLFSGTGCQIAGIKNYLRKEYSNLFLVQVFCAQVFSPLLWEKYIEELEFHAKSKLVEFDFRFKQNPESQKNEIGIAVPGWKRACYRIRFENGEEVILPWANSALANAFTNNLVMRKCCETCTFKLFDDLKVDLMIGDFWGCENYEETKELFDERGVSAVVSYTEKGDMLLRTIDSLEINPVNIKLIAQGNPSVVYSEKPHPNRDKFYAEFATINGNQEQPLMPCQIIKNNLGYLANITEEAFQIGLLGGYNTRVAIIMLCVASPSTLSWQYCNSNIMSIVDRPVKVPVEIGLPANPFREQMLRADFEKSFEEQLLENDIHNAQNYLVIDFLEERFENILFQGHYITNSDALRDAELTAVKDLFTDASYTETDWEKSCLKFIDILKRSYSKERVILVKAFLSEKFESIDGEYAYFPNLEQIRSINEKLRVRYEFFIMNHGTDHVIEIKDEKLTYCAGTHKHGVQPCHMNVNYCRALAKELADCF